MFKVVGYKEDFSIAKVMETSDENQARELREVLWQAHRSYGIAAVFVYDTEGDYYASGAGSSGFFRERERFNLEYHLAVAQEPLDKVQSMFYRNEDKEIGDLLHKAQCLIYKARAVVAQKNGETLDNNDKYWLDYK